MREHQIVINLKPDQFEEVQRMARAAGSKSVGLFVRQKLIATLGLATPRTGTDEDAEAPDLKQLTGELRRLHRELQIFVADSLSNSDYTTSSIEPIPFPTAVQENFLAEGAPLMPESVGFTYRDDSELSLPYGESSSFSSYSSSQNETAFPITQSQSPFLTEYPKPQLPGQFPPDSQSGFEQSSLAAPQLSLPAQNSQIQISPSTSRPQTTDLQAPSGIPPGGSAAQPNPGIQPAYALPPDTNAAPYAIPNAASMQPAYSVPEAPPEFPASSGQPSAPVSMPNQPVAQNVQSFAENDELEELAERAFAISPRLGPLDEAVKRFPDPLKDLLEDALLNGLDEDEEEEILESEAPEQVVSQSSVEGDAVNVENFESNDAEATSIEEVEEEASDYVEPEAETPVPAEDEPADDDTPPPASTDPPPELPPPISGGPPPRKRRT